jgi:uncharacterized protein DUF5995
VQFTYDPQLAAVVSKDATSITGVVEVLRALDDILDGTKDGLKWFNSLYLQVTLAAQKRVVSGDFDTPQGTTFIANLDAVFASFYITALRSWFTDGSSPASWRVMFEQRPNAALARIQFALAGVNAHINRDLAPAIAKTCNQANLVPAHATPEYRAYTALNDTLDLLINQAKHELMVSLPGDSLPHAAQVEMAVGAWGVGAARESAWLHGEVLYRVGGEPLLADRLTNALDDAAALAGKALMIL